MKDANIPMEAVLADRSPDPGVDSNSSSHAARGHSPLGASGAERWMNCPGSVALLKHLELDESDEPDYRREGTAMHEAAAFCLDNNLDTWEIEGREFNGTIIDRAMAQAVQVYLDHVRPIGEAASAYYVEFPVSSPVHKFFYGTLDFGAISAVKVSVRDLKGGIGIIVDPEENPQLKYYAFGLIEAHPEWPDELPVDLGIVQPRGFSPRGPIRTWETTVGEIRTWVRDELVPAMLRTELDNLLEAGPWCRFCPAKLVCPMLTSLARAAATYNPKEIVNASDEALGRSYQHVQAVKFYLKALEDETYRRLNLGRDVVGTKLVDKRANRVFKQGAAALAKERFGEKAMTTPELKSPAEIEKISPEAALFVKEFAYLPKTGLTVALASDPKPAVKVETTAEAFGAALAALQQAE